MKRNLAILLGMLISVAALVFGQAAKQANNAALRYWMAFAQMSDSQISPDDAGRIDAIVTGKAPWDESRFGALIDQNRAAIETMIRGTQLAFCEWGIEYDLGPEAPFAHLAKARTMARLDRLYAERLAASGDYDGAIRATVAGLRFAQHMAQNASFFGALTAKAALLTHLEEAQRLSETGRLTSIQLEMLRRATGALLPGGFDWQSSARMETIAMRDAMLAMSRTSDPKALYREWLGDPPPGLHAPSKSETAELESTMAVYGKLLALPPGVARNNLPALQKEISSLSPVAQALIPNPVRVLAARAEVVDAQAATAKALGTR